MSANRPTIRELHILESGDRLSRVEFERRYGAMPQLKKAELIEGVVYVASLVRIQRHANPHAKVLPGWGVMNLPRLASC